jgi:lipopolysaccharide transport system ATP-binding protein
MGNLAVRVENLSKEYKIGALAERSDNIREAITKTLSAPFRRARNILGGQAYGAAELSESIWALKDINMEVKHGEVVGIIGRNGAGKSTLLKVLSRITEPTTGVVDLYGRVGALLEVGTGFHQELTGRENVYLNGSILGMSRHDIDRKFDEIVDFAGVEKFIDTPVKHYSSGMRVRLGFSVAAHLEPEILIVDEVLSVGDAEFQKKCLGKMGDVAGEGRTVLFVSHNMGAVSQLTEKCIYLHRGSILQFAGTEDVIQHYLKDSISQQTSVVENLDFYRREYREESPVHIRSICINNTAELTRLQIGEPMTIEIEVDIHQTIANLNLSLNIQNSRGERVANVSSRDKGYMISGTPGKQTVVAHMPAVPFTPGLYFVNIGISQNHLQLAFDVIKEFPLAEVEVNASLLHWVNRPWGFVHLQDLEWRS